MSTQLKKLVRHSAVYGFGMMSLKISPLILTPLFLHRFTKAQYGTMEVLNTFSSNVQTVMMLGIGTVLIKVYLNDCRNAVERRELMSSVVMFSAALAVLVMVAAYFSRHVLSSLLTGGPTQGALVFLAALSCALIIFDRLAVLCIRARQQPGWYTVVNFAHVAAVVGFNLYLVGYRNQGVYGTQLAAVLVAVVISLVGMTIVRSDLGLVFSWPRVRHVLRLSLPVIPVSLAPWVLNSSDRYFLRAMSGLDDLGLYAVGYKIGQLATTMVVMAFQLAWSPLFFSNAETAEGPRFCASVMKYYITLLLGMALVISVFGRELLMLMGKQEFWSASALIPYVALAYVLYGLHFFTVPLFIHADKGPFLSAIMIGVAGLNLVGNYVLIRFFGIWGALGSTVISFGVLAAVSVIYANKAYPAPYSVMSILKAVVVTVAAFLVYNGFTAASWSAYLLKSTVFVAFPTALYFMGYLTGEEKARLRGVLRKALGGPGLAR